MTTATANRIGCLGNVVKNGQTLTKIDDPTKLDIRKPGFWFMFITPAIAQAWVDTFNRDNPRGRVIKNQVEWLTAIIKEGNWRPDHDWISFTSAGRLGNGQHRLLAIIAAGMGVWVRVETGVDEGVIPYWDTNKSRNTAETNCFIPGDFSKNACAASIISTWVRLKSGRTSRMTPATVQSFFRDHRDAIIWGAEIHTTERGIGRMPVLVAFCEYYERSPEQSEELYTALCDKFSLLPQARALREFLIKISFAGGGTVAREIYGKVIAACKHHASGTTWSKLYASNWD